MIDLTTTRYDIVLQIKQQLRDKIDKTGIDC